MCSGGVPEGVDRKKYYLSGCRCSNQLYWIAGGVAGALLGSVLPFDTTGIDFSMTALFLVVMTEQWKRQPATIPPRWWGWVCRWSAC